MASTSSTISQLEGKISAWEQALATANATIASDKNTLAEYLRFVNDQPNNEEARSGVNTYRGRVQNSENIIATYPQFITQAKTDLAKAREQLITEQQSKKDLAPYYTAGVIILILAAAVTAIILFRKRTKTKTT